MIWLITVGAFALVLVGSFLSLMAAHFVAGVSGDCATKCEPGGFVPSPTSTYAAS